jgi:hypothetical protein
MKDTIYITAHEDFNDTIKRKTNLTEREKG